MHAYVASYYVFHCIIYIIYFFRTSPARPGRGCPVLGQGCQRGALLIGDAEGGTVWYPMVGGGAPPALPTNLLFPGMRGDTLEPDLRGRAPVRRFFHTCDSGRKESEKIIEAKSGDCLNL